MQNETKYNRHLSLLLINFFEKELLQLLQLQ